MPLTNFQIDKAKHGSKLIKLSDGGGLQLGMMPTGSKTPSDQAIYAP